MVLDEEAEELTPSRVADASSWALLVEFWNWNFHQVKIYVDFNRPSKITIRGWLGTDGVQTGD
jgi:hypothetical protein